MVTTELLDDAAMGERLTWWLGHGTGKLGPAWRTTASRSRRLAEGHSNLTYVVRAGERELILRRPPAGPLLPTAHDVVREYRVLDLLARSDVAGTRAARGRGLRGRQRARRAVLSDGTRRRHRHP